MSSLSKLFTISFFVFFLLVGLLLITLYSASQRQDTRSRAATSDVRVTYYVSTKGADTNPGTLEAPFRTIGQAALIVNPGDTVLIREGTYNQALKIRRSGTVKGRITFKNYPDETVVIDGVGISLNYFDSLVSIGTTSLRVDFITLSGITIQNSTATAINVRGNYNQLEKLKVVNSHARAVDFEGSTYSSLANSEVTNNVRCNENGKSGCNNSLTWPVTTGISKSRYIKIASNKIYRNWGEGISSWRGSYQNKISGNTIFDNWSVNVYLDHADSTAVEGNFIYETESSYIDQTSPQRQLLANGIAIADEVYTGYGCDAKNNSVRNNIIVNTRRGISFFNYQTACGSGLKNTLVENNTIVNSWEPAIRINAGTHTATVFRNNIFFGRPGVAVLYFDTPGDTRFTNNLFYSPSSLANQFTWNGISYSNLAAWQSGTPAYLTNNIWAHPLFASPNSFLETGYRILSNSPAIDAGVAGTTADFWGARRPIDGNGDGIAKTDIGAHEYKP